jgi:hypothetical protein
MQTGSIDFCTQRQWRPLPLKRMPKNCWRTNTPLPWLDQPRDAEDPCPKDKPLHGGRRARMMMMSDFSAQNSAIGLCCLSVCYCLIFSVAYFFFVLTPCSSIRQCVILMGVSALRSWHGLGESFSWGSGSLEGIYLSWRVFWFYKLIYSSQKI